MLGHYILKSRSDYSQSGFHSKEMFTTELVVPVPVIARSKLMSILGVSSGVLDSKVPILKFYVSAAILLGK